VVNVESVVRSIAALCLVVIASIAGCGGGDDRPDLVAPPPPAETSAEPAPATAQAADGATQSVTAVRARTRVPRGERARIAEQAGAADAAVERWNRALDSCFASSGRADDPGALCTRVAWEQLFKQMYAVQYELLALSDRVGSGACHRALASAIDAVHGFLAGATPLNVVWLDERQQPPSVYDLESIVDVVRPLPARLRMADVKCTA
jgi:hypothetical protein